MIRVFIKISKIPAFRGPRRYFLSCFILLPSLGSSGLLCLLSTVFQFYASTFLPSLTRAAGSCLTIIRHFFRKTPSECQLTVWYIIVHSPWPVDCVNNTLRLYSIATLVTDCYCRLMINKATCKVVQYRNRK